MKTIITLLILPYLLVAQTPISGKKKLNGGVILEDQKEFESLPAASVPVGGYSGLIKFKDLSEGNTFPKPRDQGTQLSCVGWTLAYALRSYQENLKRNWNLESEDHLFSPAYIYNSLVRCRNDCDCGIRLSSALQLLKREGVAPLGIFPYKETCLDKPTDKHKQMASAFRIKEYSRVSDVENLLDYKLFINSKYPIIVACKINDKFKKLKKGKVFIDYKYPDDEHAMLVVGYDERNPNKKAFKVLNSWGSDWGDNGYGWIDYEAFRNMVRQAWIAYDFEDDSYISSNTNDNSISFLGTKTEVDKNRFLYRFWINSDNSDLIKDIQSVEYHFNDPLFIKKTDTNSKRIHDYASQYLGNICAENIDAIITFKNSTQTKINFNLCEIITKTENESLIGSSKNINYDFTPIITAEYKYIYKNTKYYNFHITPTGIDKFKARIEKFEYHYNHHTFKHPKETSTNKDKNFSAVGYLGWGCLTKLIIKMYYRDNDNILQVLTKEVNMCEQLGW